MIAVSAILTLSVVAGLSFRQYGPRQQALVLAGIIAAICAQFFIFGPS
jgi:hypothetical protein